MLLERRTDWRSTARPRIERDDDDGVATAPPPTQFTAPRHTTQLVFSSPVTYPGQLDSGDMVWFYCDGCGDSIKKPKVECLHASGGTEQRSSVLLCRPGGVRFIMLLGRHINRHDFLLQTSSCLRAPPSCSACIVFAPGIGPTRKRPMDLH